MFGPFDSIFDLDHDGKMSAFEKGAETDYIERMTQLTNQKSKPNHHHNDGDWHNKHPRPQE